MNNVALSMFAGWLADDCLPVGKLNMNGMVCRSTPTKMSDLESVFTKIFAHRHVGFPKYWLLIT